MTAPRVVVVAGDLPFLDVTTIEALRAATGDEPEGEGPAGAIVVDATGRDQPLVGCWSDRRAASGAAGEPGRHVHVAADRPAATGADPGGDAAAGL